MKVYERSHIAFALFTIAMVLLFIWSSVTRINDFKNYHHLIAKNAVRNVSESISHYVGERHRLFQVFANDNKQLVAIAAANPEDEALRSQLEAEIHKYFPRSFSFTITDEIGAPYFDDFDGMIGDLCLSDIRTYVDKNVANLRVHPHHEVYHYDLLARVNVSGKKYIFFISFPADEVAPFLKSAEAVDHKIMLAAKEFENIIEVSVAGARNKNYRDDYRLSNEEMTYLLAEQNVPNTDWTAYDFQSNNLFLDYYKKVIIEAVIILITFLLVGLALFSLVKKEEKKRKKAEAVKAEFVTIVSHELRTPLTSISGSIKLIENEALGPVSEKIKEYLHIASVNIERLSVIVNDILDVKKMESGSFKLNKEKINLVDVVEQALLENLDYARQFNAEFNFIKPEHDYMVYADRQRLLQVMANLLSNAIKYGAKKDKIRIYFKELQNSIRLNIEDHGGSISEDNKDGLFDKFTQLHSRDKEIVKGTGLGLNIVRNIIERHGGMLSYEVNEDKATVFYVILPVLK